MLVNGCMWVAVGPLKCTCVHTHVRPAPHSVTLLKCSAVQHVYTTLANSVYQNTLAAMYGVAGVQVHGVLSGSAEVLSCMCA